MSTARSLAVPTALLLAGVLAAAPATAVPPSDAVPADSPAPAAQTFVDEFDAPAGTPVDSTQWLMETGDNEANHERQYYTDRTANAVQDGNGHLVITAREENPDNHQCWYGPCRYTSARLNSSTTFTQAYGHFEARIKVPRGQGMWPAFWLLGSNINEVGWPACGEIDVMENVGFEPGTVHGSLHGPGYSGGEAVTGSYSLPDGQAFADDFHTFAVDWTPDSVTWSVDGNAYQTKTPADLGGDRWVFDHGFYVILNLAVGGYWPGDPDESTQFPNELLIDHVRVSAANEESGVTR